MGFSRFALVLGSGGARGFAHIGVLKVLQEEGLKPELIVGSSIGSIVGGLYALNLDIDLLLEKAESFVKNKEFLKLLRPGFNQPALINVSKIKSFLDALFGNKTFDDCRINFKAIATDIINEESVVINHGLISKAVLASSSIPGLMPPVSMDNKLLVDAGLTNPLPIDVAVNHGFKNIIAVDLTPQRDWVSDKIFSNKRIGIHHVLLASLNVMIKTITFEKLKAYKSITDLNLKIIKPFKEKPFNFLRFDKAFQVISMGEKAAMKVLKS